MTFYRTKSRKLFLRWHSKWPGSARLLIYCALTFLVLVFLHNYSKFTSTTETHEFPQIDETLKDLLRKRADASRKVLAEHGLTIPATHGTYQRILIVTTGRSGSSFTGELLSQIPGAVYNYEPLMFSDYLDRTKNYEGLVSKYLFVLSEMLECNYSPLFREFHNVKAKSWLLERNAAYLTCSELMGQTYCENADILSQVCRYFPIQVTKLVRISLLNALPFLRRPGLNLHTILLVRDPRSTIASHRQKGWCEVPCQNPHRVCDHLRNNYETALRVTQEYPGNLTVLRYEDLATEPEARTRWLLQRLGLPVTPSVVQYIKEHTDPGLANQGTTFRSKGSHIAIWKKHLPWKDIEEIQSVCQDVLSMYGYLPVPDANVLSETVTFKTDWEFPATLK